MSRIYLFIFLMAFSSFVSAKNYQYPGLSGKISNFTGVDNSQLEVQAQICGKKRGGYECHKFEVLKTKIKADGSYKLRAKFIACAKCAGYIIKHFVRNKIADKRVELFAYVSTNREPYKLTQDFIVLKLPHVSTDLFMEDGRTVYEWLNSSDAKAFSVNFEANILSEDQSCQWLKNKIYQNSRGLRTFGTDYHTMRAIVGKLEHDQDLEVNFVAYHLSADGKVIMGEKTLPLSLEDAEIEEQLKSLILKVSI